MRLDGRSFDELRKVSIRRNYVKYAEGSALIELGNTKVLCTASVVPEVPKFIRDSGRGWLTAEYGMLPRATGERNDREAIRGKQGGRTVEIQRFIGRSLRSVFNSSDLSKTTIVLDCDVIQADGGTRTAAVTGGYVALCDAARTLGKNLVKQSVAAVSVGVINGQIILDLDYDEDSKVDTDMNVVMTEDGNFVEVQGTAEGKGFSKIELDAMLNLAKTGITSLFILQKACLDKL